MLEQIGPVQPEQLPDGPFDEQFEQQFVDTMLSRLARLPVENTLGPGRAAESKLLTTFSGTTQDSQGNVTHSDLDFMEVPDPPSFPGDER